MQLSYYATNEKFMNWLCTKQKPYLKYQQLNDQLLTLRYQYYTNNSVDIRLQINNLEIKISKLLDKYFKQYDEELKPTNIERLPRIDNDISQQTFIKRTKHKISWGVSDKDEYSNKSNLKQTFTINGKQYHLEYLEDIVDENKIIFRRYEKTKVVIREKNNTRPIIDIYKKENKLIKSKIKVIKLITKDKSTIISRKLNDDWKNETTNLIILKNIIKFIDKYKL